MHKDDEEPETLNTNLAQRSHMTAKTIQLHKMTADTCETYRTVGALNQTIARNEIVMRDAQHIFILSKVGSYRPSYDPSLLPGLLAAYEV